MPSTAELTSWNVTLGIDAYCKGKENKAWQIWQDLSGYDDLGSAAIIGDISFLQEEHKYPGGIYQWDTNIVFHKGCLVHLRELDFKVFNNIGAIYANGFGTEKDHERAFYYFWLSTGRRSQIIKAPNTNNHYDGLDLADNNLARMQELKELPDPHTRTSLRGQAHNFLKDWKSLQDLRES